MTTQTDLTQSPVALGQALLGIGADTTAGKVLDAAATQPAMRETAVGEFQPARAKANRLTAGQRYKLASWMLTQDARNLEKMDAWGLGVAASHQLGFTVTGTNADFTRREVLGIRKPAKVKPAVQDKICPCAPSIAAWQIRVGQMEAYAKEQGLEIQRLRADVRTLVLAVNVLPDMDTNVYAGKILSIVNRGSL